MVEEICYHMVELDINLYQSAWEHTTFIGNIRVSKFGTLLFRLARSIIVHIAEVRTSDETIFGQRVVVEIKPYLVKDRHCCILIISR